MGARGEVSTRKFWIFGCFGEPGHYLWDMNRRYCSARELGFPGLDGYHEPRYRNKPTPREQQVEGRAWLHHGPGYTSLHWWDRQGDRRHGSHTAIVVRGEATARELLALAQQRAPWAIRVEVRLP